MLSVSPSTLARSSLEEMLDSLRRRDEIEKPNDSPPALPARPTSKARRPSAKRPLSSKLDNAFEQSTNFSSIKKEEVKRSKGRSFGGKKSKEADPDESPYVSMALEQMEFKQRVGENGGANLASAAPPSPLRFRESELNDNIGYFIKKVLTVSTRELLPANPDILKGVDDLIQLSYLNEPSVLHNLQYRYSHDIIYSKAGPVLIAINPFKKLELYGNDYVTAYRLKLLDNPHVYAIADTAYNEMMRDEVNQSIIISGESGARKTETAKIAMQYLGALGGGNGGINGEILQTSHILEAFGNAKTSRNDNSSRFGKLIEIHFSSTGKICGAKIQTFLLEKSRVVQLAHGERSYHIFYQLCAGAPSVLRERLNLKAASEYKYLNQSGCLTIDNVDDAQRFQKLMEALNTIHMSKEDQVHAFEMLAAVLWLGNISFQVIDNENHVDVVADEACTRVASLIGCSAQDLMLALSTYRIQAGQDNLAKKLTLQQAIDTRDALAKFVYASLFDWLVEKINRLLEKGKQQTGRSISILDIYGFESFQKNSFEQFCINYANERLQQHFNRHLFKLQQEEYEVDGIDWTKIEFEDDQDCLDLFEKKPIGLISLLDEETNFPKASDLTFANKLKQHLNTNPCFKGEKGGAFSIRHYAGEVLYNTTGFLEKNRDLLRSDIIRLLSSCSSQLPQLFASSMRNQLEYQTKSIRQLVASELRKRSVGTKFKSQLFKLMQQLENSTPHFIRCIKPNSKHLPGIYEKNIVLEQLRCCGVLEVVRISRSGYPTRMTHQEFAGRYGFLLLEFGVSQDPLSISVSVLQQFGFHPEMYQVGYTKLYFRVGQIGALEETRKQVLQGTLKVQKCFRRHQAHSYFHELKRGVITLQSFVRAEHVRKKYDVLINLRQQVAMKTLDKQLRAVLHLQLVIRGWLARKYFNHLRNLKRLNHDNSISEHKHGRRIYAVEQHMPQQHNRISPSVIEELQRRVLKAEASLEKKELENSALRDQVQQFEARWLEYEAKMKSMEDTWQKQTASLQMGLAAVKKSLVADNTSGQPGRQDGSLSPSYYDSEDTNSIGTTPGASTPIKICNSVSEFGAGQLSNGNMNAVSHLMKEFEQRKQNFDDEVKAIAEVNSGQSLSANPGEELQNLKHKFDTWKKDYKARLRETKARLPKLGLSEAEKHRRKWWGGKSKKF